MQNLSFSESTVVPRLYKSLQRMMDFLCKAAALASSDSPLVVASFVWEQIQDKDESETILLPGDTVKYTLRFIRQALAMSLAKVETIMVTMRDEMNRIAEIAINTEVLLELPTYEQAVAAVASMGAAQQQAEVTG